MANPKVRSGDPVEFLDRKDERRYGVVIGDYRNAEGQEGYLVQDSMTNGTHHVLPDALSPLIVRPSRDGRNRSYVRRPPRRTGFEIPRSERAVRERQRARGNR